MKITKGKEREVPGKQRIKLNRDKCECADDLRVQVDIMSA